MAMRMLTPSDPLLQVIVFFASAPDEELLTQDIAAKTGVSRGDVFQKLNQAVRHGMIERVRGSRGRMRMESCYRAGPELLKMIGRAP